MKIEKKFRNVFKVWSPTIEVFKRWKRSYEIVFDFWKFSYERNSKEFGTFFVVCFGCQSDRQSMGFREKEKEGKREWVPWHRTNRWEQSSVSGIRTVFANVERCCERPALLFISSSSSSSSSILFYLCLLILRRLSSLVVRVCAIPLRTFAYQTLRHVPPPPPRPPHRCWSSSTGPGRKVGAGRRTCSRLCAACTLLGSKRSTESPTWRMWEL